MESFRSYDTFILIFCGVMFFLVLSRYLSDKAETFENYLKPELDSKGFKFQSSNFIYLNIYNNPFIIEDSDISISHVSGGLGAVQYNVYSTYRKVIFIDGDGKKREVLASLDFKGFWSRKLKRVRWHPNLESFNKNSKRT